MNCEQCEESTGERTVIAYTNGESERIRLCADCRERFSEGDLIESVAVTDE